MLNTTRAFDRELRSELMRGLACLLLAAALGFAQNPTAEQIFNDALAAQRRGDFTAAVNDYERVLKLAPRLLPARANLAAALLQLGRVDEAIANYRLALRQDPGNVQIAILLGNTLVLRHSYGEAIALLQPVEKAHPENLDIAFVLGEALIDAQRPSEGLKRVQRVAAARNDADAWLLAGLTQLKLGDFAKARTNVEAALRANAALPGAYTLLGITKVMAGDEQAAKADYRKALEMNQNDFDANLRLGTILRTESDLLGARKYLESALRLDPSSQSARYEWALMEVAQGDDRAAVADLERIVQSAPNLLQAHVRLAALYYRVHRNEDGMRERQIVDRLLANPKEQDRRLTADPSLSVEMPGPANGRAPLP